MSTYPKWLRKAASKGGKKSRRKLTKKQAREMVKARERKRAAGVALKPCEQDGARSTTESSSAAELGRKGQP
jgi:hypothetical protein